MSVQYCRSQIPHETSHILLPGPRYCDSVLTSYVSNSLSQTLSLASSRLAPTCSHSRNPPRRSFSFLPSRCQPLVRTAPLPHLHFNMTIPSQHFSTLRDPTRGRRYVSFKGTSRQKTLRLSERIGHDKAEDRYEILKRWVSPKKL